MAEKEENIEELKDALEKAGWVVHEGVKNDDEEKTLREDVVVLTGNKGMQTIRLYFWRADELSL